eukprot:1883185-Prymnesium_polylepis.1
MLDYRAGRLHARSGRLGRPQNRVFFACAAERVCLGGHQAHGAAGHAHLWHDLWALACVSGCPKIRRFQHVRTPVYFRVSA